MNEKHYAQVLIDGKIYTLGGAEEAQYLQKVASYINDKTAQLKAKDGFSKQSQEYQSVMIQLNIADDYFKAKKLGDSLQSETENKDTAMYDLKHELIAAQIQLETANKQIEELKEEINKYQKNVVRLETELEDLKK